MLRKTKKDYFSKLNPKLVSGNKNFWRTIKPYFSEKGNFSDKIMISEKDCIVSDDRRLSKVFNEHFINIAILTKRLNSSLEKGCFPNQLRLAEVTPVLKK